MRLKGVGYDVGRALGMNWRPVFAPTSCAAGESPWSAGVLNLPPPSLQPQTLHTAEAFDRLIKP